MKKTKEQRIYRLGSKKDSTKYEGFVVRHIEREVFTQEDFKDGHFAAEMTQEEIKQVYSPIYHLEAEIGYFSNFLSWALQGDEMALFLLEQMQSRSVPSESDILKMRPYGNKTFALVKYLDRADKSNNNRAFFAAKGLEYMILARHEYENNDIDQVVLNLTRAASMSRITELIDYEPSIHQGWVKTEGLKEGNPVYSPEVKISYCKEIDERVSNRHSVTRACQLIQKTNKEAGQKSPAMGSLRAWYAEFKKTGTVK